MLFVRDGLQSLINETTTFGFTEFSDSFSGALTAPIVVPFATLSVTVDPDRTNSSTLLALVQFASPIWVTTFQDPAQEPREPFPVFSTLLGGKVNGDLGDLNIVADGVQNLPSRIDLPRRRVALLPVSVSPLGEAKRQKSSPVCI